jgi:hypothetical protein
MNLGLEREEITPSHLRNHLVENDPDDEESQIPRDRAKPAAGRAPGGRRRWGRRPGTAGGSGVEEEVE